MSRVGRDYLQTGFYTEILFREKGVRFIAISNNIDSNDAGSNEFAPFLNIMGLRVDDEHAVLVLEVAIGRLARQGLSAHALGPDHGLYGIAGQGCRIGGTYAKAANHNRPFYGFILPSQPGRRITGSQQLDPESENHPRTLCR